MVFAVFNVEFFESLKPVEILTENLVSEGGLVEHLF